MITLMYITNKPEVALIAERSNVDRVFLDMEYIGKAERQSGMDTAQCAHTIEDIKNIRKVIAKSELLVRCNSIYSGSEEEINNIIDAGADVIMLPYFKTADEVAFFIKTVA